MRRTLANERGVVLVLGLIMLVVLSFMGLAAMQSTTMQERMAGNLQKRNGAFQHAEAGLREAEAWIAAQVAGASLPAFNNSNGLYQLPPVGDPPRWQSVDWDASSGNYRLYQGEGLEADYPLPRHIIEFITLIANPDSQSLAVDDVPENFGMYRITSRATGPNNQAEVIIQSTFLR